MRAEPENAELSRLIHEDLHPSARRAAMVSVVPSTRTTQTAAILPEPCSFCTPF